MTATDHVRTGTNAIRVRFTGGGDAQVSLARAECDCGAEFPVRHWERYRAAMAQAIDDAIAHRYASPAGCVLAFPPAYRGEL